MRTEFLRGYLIELLGEGAIGGKSAKGISKKIAATVAGDIQTVAGDLARMAIQSASAKLMQDIDGKGLGAVWSDLRANFRQGVEDTANNAIAPKTSKRPPKKAKS